jgi:hypothetical protein
MSLKPIRQAFYVGSEARMRRLERLRVRLGHTSISETLRWLVDRATEQAAIYEPGDQVALAFLTPARSADQAAPASPTAAGGSRG